MPNTVANFVQVSIRGLAISPVAIFCTVVNFNPATSATRWRWACDMADNRVLMGVMRSSMMVETIANKLAIRKKYSPHLDHPMSEDIGMEPRDILAANVKRLKAHYKLSNLKLAKKTSVANGTIGRITLAQGDADIGTINMIAKAFDLSAWQLLTPNLDPDNPHHVCTISPEEEALYYRLKAALKTVG